jgi:hypothetical protein
MTKVIYVVRWMHGDFLFSDFDLAEGLILSFVYNEVSLFGIVLVLTCGSCSCSHSLSCALTGTVSDFNSNS